MIGFGRKYYFEDRRPGPTAPTTPLHGRDARARNWEQRQAYPGRLNRAAEYLGNLFVQLTPIVGHLARSAVRSVVARTSRARGSTSAPTSERLLRQQASFVDPILGPDGRALPGHPRTGLFNLTGDSDPVTAQFGGFSRYGENSRTVMPVNPVTGLPTRAPVPSERGVHPGDNPLLVSDAVGRVVRRKPAPETHISQDERQLLQ